MTGLIFSNTAWLAVMAALLGLLIGSFLNVVIYRFPVMMQRSWERECAALRNEAAPEQSRFNLAIPSSRCRACGHELRYWENIPVFSYLFLRGKCSACSAPIGLRYPTIELVTGILFGLSVYQFDAEWRTIPAIFLLCTLLVLAMIDYDTQYLPDDFTLPLLWVGLAVNLYHGWATLPDAVLGAMAGYLILWSIYWIFKLFTGKEGMGYGDFKLLAALGAWFGWQALPGILLLSSISGAVIGSLWLVLSQHGKDHPIPFGPFLVAAGALNLFFADFLHQIWSVLAS